MIDLTPPKGAQEAARRALEVRATKPPSERGMTAVGLARARDLANGKRLSPETVRRMLSFFARHEVDKKGETWDEQGPGWQAWHGWGGDAGYAWARKVVDQLERQMSYQTEVSKDPGEAPAVPSSVCLVLLPDPEDAEALALPGGEDPSEIHLTVRFLGEVNPPDLVVRLAETLPAIAAALQPVMVGVAGQGRFWEEDQDIVVALASSPGLEALRITLTELALSLGWVPDPDGHGFIPHLTLAYGPTGFDPGSFRGPDRMVLSRLALWAGSRRAVYELGRPLAAPTSGVSPMSDMTDASLEQVVTPEGGRRVLSIKLDVTDLLPIAAPVAAPIAAPIAAPAATVPAELPAEPAEPPAVIPARVPDAPITSRVVAFDAGQQATAALVDPADWNRQHALGRLRAWASSDGSGDRSTIDAEKLSAAFAWYDPDSAGRGTMSAFRLPHHDIRDGALVVSRAGLLSAARAYMTGDVGIPDDDMGLCRLHLERHFAQLKEDPPWYTAPGATDLRVADDVVTLDARTKPGTIPGVLSVSWIQVAKVGTFRGHPMGPFAFTPEVFATIIANFLATENRMVPVDYEHATEALGESVFQDGAPAVGWIVELDNRGSDGLWGRVEWIDAAAVEHIRQGRYRYFSPAVAFNATDRVTGKAIGPTLVSGGLTNRPFLDGMAVVTAREPAPAIGASIPDGVTPETAADTSPAVSTSPAATVVTASAVAPATVEPAIETLPVKVEVAPAVTVAPATVLAPEPLPAKVRLRAELDAAWSRAPEKGLRTMSWYEGIDDREDLIEMLRCILGLSQIAPEVEVLLGVAQLAVYVAGDLGVRDGVEVVEIVGRLRNILRLPALTTLEGVLAAIRSALQDPTFTEGAASMAVSPASVHVPAAISTATVEPCSAAAAAETTLVSPGATCDMNATAIAAALNLSASASEEEILTAVNGLNGNVAAMSARLAAHDRKAAETEVDALIAQKRIDQEGRNGAVTLRLTQPENFLAMFPARAPTVEIAPAPVPTPAVVAPVVAAMRTAETPAAMSADMGVSVLPGNAGSTHLPPAGSVVKLPTSAQEHSEAVYTRATALRKLDGALSLRQAMIAAEDEIAADRRVLSAKV